MIWQQIDPLYGKNYNKGQFYFTFHLDSPLSHGISWFSREYLNAISFNWSHCGIVLGDNLGAESNAYGVQLVKLNDYFNNNYCRISMRELKDDFDPDRISEIAMKYVGNVHYDYKLIFGYFIANCLASRILFTQKFRDKILDKFNSEGRFICSEFCARVLREYGYDKIPKILIPNQIFHLPAIWKEWK